MFQNFLPSATPAATAPTPGNIPANAAQTLQAHTDPATAPNGTIPASTVAEITPESKLDVFNNLWQNDPASSVQGQPLFNVSQDKLIEAARTQDFRTAATPEQLQAIQAGGAEAIAATMEIMNAMTQNVYAKSAFSTTKLIEAALEKSQFAKTSDIESTMKRSNLSQSLRDSNPVFSHPSAAPLIDAVKNQMVVKFPHATQKELTEMAQGYLTNFATAINAPAQAAQAAKAAPKQDDWSAFFQ